MIYEYRKHYTLFDPGPSLPEKDAKIFEDLPVTARSYTVQHFSGFGFLCTVEDETEPCRDGSRTPNVRVRTRSVVSAGPHTGSCTDRPGSPPPGDR